MVDKITPEEAAAIQQVRDDRRTALFKEFCREMGGLPDTFRVGIAMNEEMMRTHFEPVANRLYEYMKQNEMTAGDIEYVKNYFQTIFGYTLARVQNFAAVLVGNAMRKHFGVGDIIEELPLSQLELQGIEVIDEVEKPEEGKDEVK